MEAIEAKLELPQSVEVQELTPEILLLKNVASWGRDIVETANAVGKWTSSVIGQDKTLDQSWRLSDGVMIDRQLDPRFQLFEEAAFRCFGRALQEYCARNAWAASAATDIGYTLLRYKTNGFYKEHVDAGPSPPSCLRQLSMILFLNDDYLGGEFVFTRQKIELKPQPGDLLVFPSGFCYPHEAKPVLEGEKYGLVTWFVCQPQAQA